MLEIWKKLYTHEGYEISNHGRVRSLNREVKLSDGNYRFVRGGFMTTRRGGNTEHLIFEIRLGYNTKTKKYKRKTFTLARAVADHFVPKPISEEKLCATHIDGDKHNNRFDNIRWIPHSDVIRGQKRDYEEAWLKRKNNK